MAERSTDALPGTNPPAAGGWRHVGVSGTAMQQLFLTDPDGIRIELNFAAG